ncbi:C40 family peptidase [Streptomyces sp. NPDC046870]|uniref:C40 family peptidase n=1 Tax=Streptomyces sp. NPDC046870 TaxID=3155135 RepID=UPI003451D46C
MSPESRDEVRQRIASLYDRAENDTGNFNATRAMAARTRSRGVPLAKRAGRRQDPALDEVARKWFDAARAAVGPTVPAVLPADRLPDRSAAPARSREPMDGVPLPGGEREVRALPGGGGEPLALPRGGGDALGLPALPGGGEPRALPGGERRALGTGGLPEQRSAGREPGTGRVVAELTTGSVTGSVTDATSGFLPGGALPGESLPTGFLPGWAVPGGALRSEPSQTAGLPATGPLPVLDTGPTALVDTTSGTDLPGAGIGWGGGAADTSGRGLTGTAEPVGWATAIPAGPAVAPVAAPVVQRAAVQLPRALPGSAGLLRLSPAASKAGARRKLDTARDLLSGRTLRAGLPDTADRPWTATAQSAMTSAVPWQRHGAEPVVSAAPVASPPPVGITAPMTDTGSLSLPLPLPLPAPAPVEPPRAPRAAKAIAFARAQLGKPCVWGATGPDSYDCSSLTQAAWKAAGVTLPRAAHEQALAGTPLTTAGLEPGDLVLFFEDDRHVGLYVGDGMMVHAPGPGSSIREESIYGAGEAAIHRIIRPA